MINEILREYKGCSYDFRDHAFRDDPLAHLFGEWVDYYRMKWAISRALRPKSVLEIGVRYGYSARAFLDASPEALYLGLDADLPSFGGCVGALSWAANSLEAFTASFTKVDTQTLSRLPGSPYDLVHVDGQQDGDGTYHDMNLALDRAQYILVDGYFWTRENFLAANEWLALNRAAVQWSVVIPGYAGELLIKAAQPRARLAAKEAASSDALAESYTKLYYLTDCGGYAEWRRSGGKALTDSRLRTVADVAWALRTPAKVFDLGAGRGELTRHFAEAGASVTAVDYAQDALDLIEQTFADEKVIRDNVTLVCGSVTDPTVYGGMFDLAVASDVIEHLSPGELDAFYQQVAAHLDPDGGIFVVHTAPNLWNYRYEHARQRRAARLAGCWLPRTRRTYYERLMHINEQSPRVLRRQLRDYFPHVLLWFAGPHPESNSLSTRFRIGDMRRATSLFAVASHRPIDELALRSALRMEPLSSEQSAKVALQISGCPQKVNARARFSARIVLHNSCGRLLTSRPPHPFYLSYHWERAEDGKPVVFEGLRTPLTPASRAGASRGYAVDVLAPEAEGRYALKVTPVQEGVRWHEAANEVRTIVDVVGAR